jgi:hypothetical protein
MSAPKLTVYQTADDLHLAELSIPAGIEFSVDAEKTPEIHVSLTIFYFFFFPIPFL